MSLFMTRMRLHWRPLSSLKSNRGTCSYGLRRAGEDPSVNLRVGRQAPSKTKRAQPSKTKSMQFIKPVEVFAKNSKGMGKVVFPAKSRRYLWSLHRGGAQKAEVDVLIYAFLEEGESRALSVMLPTLRKNLTKNYMCTKPCANFVMLILLGK